jgi:hypothetical protein
MKHLLTTTPQILKKFPHLNNFFELRTTFRKIFVIFTVYCHWIWNRGIGYRGFNETAGSSNLELGSRFSAVTETAGSDPVVSMRPQKSIGHHGTLRENDYWLSFPFRETIAKRKKWVKSHTYSYQKSVNIKGELWQKSRIPRCHDPMGSGAHTKRRKTKRRISKRRHYKTSNHKSSTLQICTISYNSILFQYVKWTFNQT